MSFLASVKVASTPAIAQTKRREGNDQAVFEIPIAEEDRKCSSEQLVRRDEVAQNLVA